MRRPARPGDGVCQFMLNALVYCATNPVRFHAEVVSRELCLRDTIGRD